MEKRSLYLKILWLHEPDGLTCFICRRPPMLWLKLPPASPMTISLPSIICQPHDGLENLDHHLAH